jgi:type I site-specific restriction-modification system R (restriction) subunit
MAIGEMKQADREKSYSASVIVATTQLIATGFNEPRLDTLIMATPIAGNTLLQAIGRIRRLHENKKPPFVLDLVDSRYEGAVISAKARFAVYLNNQWLVNGYELFDKEYLCNPRVASKINQMNLKRQQG